VWRRTEPNESDESADDTTAAAILRSDGAGSASASVRLLREGGRKKDTSNVGQEGSSLRRAATAGGVGAWRSLRSTIHRRPWRQAGGVGRGGKKDRVGASVLGVAPAVLLSSEKTLCERKYPTGLDPTNDPFFSAIILFHLFFRTRSRHSFRAPSRKHPQAEKSKTICGLFLSWERGGNIY
jgi:hypothetical protein